MTHGFGSHLGPSETAMSVVHAVNHTFPALQALQLIELVKRWNVAPDELLRPFRLEEKALEDPQARLPLETMRELLERARSLTGEPGLGYYLGLQKRISFYGFVGYAAMSASTLHEALDLGARFTPLVTTALTMHLHVQGENAALVIESHGHMGSAHDIATLSLVIGLAHIGSTLTGRELQGHIEIALPEPAYASRFRDTTGGQVRWGYPKTQIVFSAADLSLPLVAPDPAMQRVLTKQCEDKLAELGFDRTLEQRVRRMLPCEEGFRSLDEVSSALSISPRTLKRKLAARGTTFSELLDRERCEHALLLLRSTHSIDDIAQRLGYSTPPNFVRAFRRWLGTTPAAYRRAHV